MPAILRRRRSRRLRSRTRTLTLNRWILMWCTFRPMIRGWFTDIRWWRGRDGTPIRESGLRGRIYRLAWGLELGGTGDLGGDGVIGDSTGITTTCCLITRGTTHEAIRFITGAIIIAAEWSVEAG